MATTPVLGMDDNDDMNTPTIRRTTRSALSDVSHRTILPTTPSWNINFMPTPSPSPDELIIQQRGRRKIPATWSPDVKRDRTPVKLPPSPNKSSIVLRSTPRKRLLLGDPTDPPSPEKTPRKVSRVVNRLGDLSLQGSTPLKKMKTERLGADNPLGPLPCALKGLSQEQLIEMLLDLTKNHPELEEELREAMPTPDLRPMEDQLSYLKKNIFKSLPTSRLTSKYDSPAYNRANTHVLSFKKSVVEFGRQLVDSQHWGTVIEYVLMAWGYVRATPLWENTTHNTARRQCFKSLASQCMTALKRGSFTLVECKSIAEKLEGLQCDSEDIQSCLKQLDVMRARQTTPTKIQ